MKNAPGRQTRPAYSRKRRTWYGHMQRARVEKSGFGRFLHDATYVFGDVSAFALPSFFYVMAAADGRGYGVTAGALVAWATMVFVGTAIRGGWVAPFATDVLGWVSIRPALLLLRLAYYNLVVVLAAYGGVVAAGALAWPPASLAIAFVVAGVATLSFPAIAESVARRLDA